MAAPQHALPMISLTRNAELDELRVAVQEPGKPLLRAAFFGKNSSLIRCLVTVIFFTVLSNIPFWIACRWFGILQNGWFCLDYLFVGLVSMFVPRVLGSVLLLLFIAVDLIAGVSETYLLPIMQCFKNLGALREFSLSRDLEVGAVAFITLLIVIAAPYLAASVRKKHRVPVAVFLAAFAIISLSIDSVAVLRGLRGIPGFAQSKRSLENLVQAGYFSELGFSRIPSVRLGWRMIFPAPSGLPMQSAAAFALASVQQVASNDNQEMPNFVVVLVESWGLDQDSSVRDALIQPYSQPGLSAHYQILHGTVPFAGPTLGGEGRELCGSTIGFQLMSADARKLQSCLPDRLAALGYHNVALHGMVGDMFDRAKWYKAIGFQEMWFFHQFLKLGMPICPGPFPGMCDAEIARWMARRLDERKEYPEFLYWVTLNSHLPVPVPSPLKTGATCSFSPSIAKQPALCSWYQLIANVHQSTAELAMSNLARPTVFAIVGDHAPPFSDPTLRKQFSQTVVPYVLLVPRRDGTAAK